MFTFEVSEGQEEDDHAWDDSGLTALILQNRVGLSQRVSDDEVSTYSTVKDEAISASGIIAKSNKIHEVIEERHRNVEADSIPEEILCFSIKARSVEGRNNKEGDNNYALQNLVNLVGAHLIKYFSEAVSGEAFPFLWFEGQDVGFDS